ncbi:hypothetical protein ONE63_006213 [Megalurothrips usitatus]|uniref:C2H2-type domain-containing protein n=1 Tax=Megalurothrips usitatus TaxID=439358 RepID=A0AAV7XW26_9NEOP|nr:hypothetical protein ONE63_006213 [Megalurothrips usitatus]
MAYECERCGKLYNHLSSFNRHRKFECGKEPAFPCALCSYRGKRRERLVEHIKNVHEGEYRRRSMLHRLHRGGGGRGRREPLRPSSAANSQDAPAPPDGQQQDDAQFSCHSCEKRYRDYNSLWKHVKFSCGNKAARFQCPLCPVRCKRRDTVKRHMNKFHGPESLALTVIELDEQAAADASARVVR